MPTQVKFLLGAMIAGAVLIFGSLFLTLRDNASLGANIFNVLGSGETNQNSNLLQEKATFSDQSDIDKDGLLDYEEVIYGTDPLNSDTDGDGFLDGEEIASKRNPLIPGPNDELIKNLTKRVSELTLSGLTEGSLKPDSPNYVKSLNLVVDEILYQAQMNLSTSQISINIVPDSYETIKIYERGIVPLLESMIDREAESILKLVDLVDETAFFDQSKLNSQDKSFQDLHNFVSQRIFEISRDLSVLEKSPVPEVLSKKHKYFIKNFKNMALSYSYLAKADSDPIQAMMSFRNILIVFTEELPNLNKN